MAACQMPEKHLRNSFLLYLVLEILQLVHEISCSIKEVFWISSQNSQINTSSSHSEVLCQKMFLKVLQNSYKKHLCRCLLFKKVAGWKHLTGRSSRFAKNLANFVGKNLCWSLFLIKVEFWGHATLLKKTLKNICERLF